MKAIRININIMSKRKRIYRPIAVRWEANPLWELAKIKAKELGITSNEAVRLIKLQDELSKVPELLTGKL